MSSAPIRNRALERSADDALRRIFGFIAFYSLLILCGFVVLTAACGLTWWVLGTLIPALLHHLKLVVLLLVMLAGIWGVALLVGGILIEPLFRVEKSNPETVRIVTKQDAPELFELIEETAREVGTSMPKTVYLTPEADACVFFDASYWGLFKGAEKNLSIGAGLMADLSRSEFKAVLAHEFGHVAQSAMRCGSAVWMLNQMIDLLLSSRSRFDGRIDAWAQADSRLWRLFGSAAKRLLRFIRSLVLKRWLRVRKADLSLSRQMEFDADAAAGRTAGIGNTISMLAKLPVLSRRQTLCGRLLNEFCREKGELLTDFWGAYRSLENLFERNDGVRLSAAQKLAAIPAGFEGSDAWLSLEDVWDTHPAIADRIEALRRLEGGTAENAVQEAGSDAPAMSLIPASMARTVGAEAVSAVMSAEPKRTAKTNESQETSQFALWAAGEFARYIPPISLAPYIDRDLVEFDLSRAIENALAAPQPDPFVPANNADVRQYAAALEDASVLHDILLSRREAEALRYGSIRLVDLHSKNLDEALSQPLALAEERLQSLEPRVRTIDEAVFKWLYSHEKPADRGAVARAYCDIFYAQSFLSSADALADRGERLQAWLDRVNEQLLDAKKAEAEVFMKETSALMDDVTALLPYIDWDALEDVEDASGLEELRRTADTFVAKDEKEAEETVETRTLTSFAQNIVHLHEALRLVARGFIADRVYELRAAGPDMAGPGSTGKEA